MKHTTKRFLAIVLALALCLSLLPGIALAASEYVLVTDVTDITSGGQFIIVANNGTVCQAMPTTLSSGKFVGQDVTVTGDSITGDSLPVWTIEAVDGGIAISIDGSYLAYKSSTNFQMSTTAYTWTVTAANGGYVLDSSATTRGIYYQTSSAKFGAYATSNATASGYISGLQLYKLQEGGDACVHEYTSEVTTAATCTEDGVETYTCSLCGDSYTKVISATGHSYVDDTCTVCGVTVVDLSGNYYIAAIRSSGNYMYMTGTLTTTSTKRYVAMDSGVTELPASIDVGLPDRTFTLTRNADMTYTICAYGNESAYLGWTSGNSGALVTADSALSLTVEAISDTQYNITTAAGRILALNSTSGNDYFAFYSSGQSNALCLIPVTTVGAECTHTNTEVQDVVAATCTAEGYTGDTVCSDCGEIITAGEATAALGHTNEDGDNYCDVCGAQVASDIVYNKTTVLNAGDTVLLISESAAMELSSMSTTSTVYGIGTAYTTAPVGLMPLTVVTGAAEGTVAFQTADALYLSWVSGNSLTTSATLDANSSWTVTFDMSGNAAIVNSADATRSVRWNTNSPRFACYTSGQADVQLYKQVVEGGCAHTETTVNGAVAATCTTDGHEGNTVCTACGETTVFGTVIAATGHTEVVDAAVDATCTMSGLTEGSHCSVCSEVITAQSSVNAVGHTYVEGICTICAAAEVLAPADAAEIVAAAYALAHGEVLPYTATLTGVITSIDSVYNETYKNINVTIAVPGCEDYPIMCYRMTGEGIDALVVGDTITVTGLLTNYNGAVEFKAGCTADAIIHKEYCLVGYINGADYGCNDDYQNVGEYIFVDGTLTTSFTADSYIFVKTTDNANWYLTEAYTEETSATFVTGASEKMKVPANYNITFTLVENTDGSVTVSYVLGDKIETEATYYVAGDFNEWNAAAEGYLMTANEDGTYSLSIAVTAGDHQLKVTNGTWDVSWGADTTSGNYEFNASADGTVTVTFDGSNITVTGDVVGEVEKEPLTITSMHVAGAAGLTGADWDPSANQMSAAMGVYSITFENVAAGTYEFKFVANGTWDLNWASGVAIASGETQTAYINALGNSSITVAEDGSTVTLTFNMTTMDIVTGEGATMTAEIVAPVVVANPLVLGENALTLAAGDLDGDTWTYTATEAGTLSIDVTALSYDDGSGTGTMTEVPADYIGMVFGRQYSVVINGVPNYAYPAEVTVAAGDAVSVQIYSGMGTATNVTLSLTFTAGGDETPAEPGTSDNPIVIEALPYEITVDGTHDIYYTYTAAEDGIIVITKPAGNYVSGLTNYVTDADGNYYETVTAGSVVSINPWGDNAGTYTIAYGEAPTFEDVSIYFDASLYGWTNVNAYAWTSEGVTVSADWPGSAMTQNEDGIWTIAIPSNANYVIFNNGDQQTWDLDFYADYIYNGMEYAVYGTELNTTFYVTGDGVFGEWVADNANGIMTNNGNGTFTATISGVEASETAYGYKVTMGSWDKISWGDWSTSSGNCEITITEKSDVTVTFDLINQTVTAEATAVVEDPVVIPTLTLKAPTLEFKDMITVNAMFTAENIEDVVEMGMITYTEQVAEWSVETANHVIPGTTYDVNTGRYIAASQGIHAKYLGDAVYLACYAKLTDGSYVYTKLASYSPVQYATSKLNGTDTALKQLVAAMLNYGAAAQTHFDHNVDNLANAGMTAEQLALPEAYRSDMVSTVAAADATKQGAFANNKGFAKRYPSISFEGAFCINYFFTPNYAPVDGITLYYWNAADFEAVDVLSTENASGSMKLEGEGTGEYRGDIVGIAAKALSEAVYVAAVYSDGTTEWTSGVLGYSIGAYCASKAADTGTIADLAMATAVYGYHAKAYFG